ncbi:Uncharacterized protein TCM_032418 [Theobroma cacao]|uniref:Reverse transcriptase zinc-binding domain-containing protein n=1 Tax=Theobroma cacao TaxID=3641 RepID=A0A061FA56_THECC|nr:Uncharacterized protein TCM_032418 [Theobroma cacao]
MVFFGNGLNICFWHDGWMEEVPLKITFPRIYALSINKSGTVSEFGKWLNNKWLWEIKLKKRLFDWETKQWETLNTKINDILVDNSEKDKFIWKGSTNGVYSVKNFYRACVAGNNADNANWNAVWEGLAPLKVEMLCWLVLKGKLAVRAEFVKTLSPLMQSDGPSFPKKLHGGSSILFSRLIKFKTKVGKWNIVRYPRSGNNIADMLAKEGVGRTGDLFMVMS